MTQHTLFDPHRNELTPDFDGKTYNRELDGERLKSAMGKVYLLLRDGNWHTLAEIAAAGGCRETAASARARDFRKPKFQAIYGACSVESRRVSGGVWEYRLIKGA